MTAPPIRVLVVDDSALVRRTVARLIAEDPGLTVVGIAADGRDALEQVARLHPDVVTLDISMPVMDGMTCLGILVRDHRQRVVILSTHARESSFTTFKALALGAIDFVTKPGSEGYVTTPEVLGQELRAKIRAAATVPPEKLVRRLEAPPHPAAGLLPAAPSAGPTSFAEALPRGLIGVGGSTGGTAALETLLRALPHDFPASLVAVQHMPAGFSSSFARYLDSVCPFPVSEAADGEVVRSGRVYVAPGNVHLRVQRTPEGNLLRLDAGGAAMNGYRPSIDALLYSLALAERGRAVGVLLSGMGEDGVNGLGAVMRLGGQTLVQDRESSIVYGMAEKAVASGFVREALPAAGLARAIVEAVKTIKVVKSVRFVQEPKTLERERSVVRVA